MRTVSLNFFHIVLRFVAVKNRAASREYERSKLGWKKDNRGEKIIMMKKVKEHKYLITVSIVNHFISYCNYSLCIKRSSNCESWNSYC